MTLLAYRFALDPTPRQERALRSQAGAARVVFNTGLDALARALKNWEDSRTGRRKGPKVGFPRFRSRRRSRPSVRFTTGAIRCEPTHAVLPRLGRVKLPDRWRRADAARNHALGRVADQRRDGIHKLTTTLASTYGTVVVEDLHVAGMVRNRRLARHVADASFAEIRRQLAYKIAWHGGTLIVADRWFASSKTCSECGAVKAKLALSEREWTCTDCGTVLDRDVNAAVNLARLAGSGPDSNGRGADQKTRSGGQVAVKRQPGGTAPAVRETGILPPQGESAA